MSEIAEASIVLASELPARHGKTSHADVLIDTAKRIERLAARRRKLRRELKTVESEIRHEKKNLRALVQQIGRGES